MFRFIRRYKACQKERLMQICVPGSNIWDFICVVKCWNWTLNSEQQNGAVNLILDKCLQLSLSWFSFYLAFVSSRLKRRSQNTKTHASTAQSRRKTENHTKLSIRTDFGKSKQPMKKVKESIMECNLGVTTRTPLSLKVSSSSSSIQGAGYIDLVSFQNEIGTW